MTNSCSFRLNAILLAGLLAGFTATAQPLAVRGVSVKAASEQAALREASVSALKFAISEMRLEATETQLDQLLNNHPECLERAIIKLEKADSGVALVVDFLVQADAVRSALVRREVARASEALGSPQIAFAIVPIAPKGTVLDAGSKRSFIGQLNTALKEVFSDAKFRVVSPDWLLSEINDFSGDPANTEEFELNARYRAKMDPDVHYLIAGTATIDTKDAAGETEVHLVVEGSVLSTFTENPLSVPFQYNGSIRGAGERVAIGQACQLVAERAARSKALPRLISDWNDQVELGTEYTVHLLYDDPEFKNQVLTALESAGQILDLSSLNTDLLRLRYRTKTVQRKDFGDSFLLGRRLKGLPSRPAVYCVSRQSEIVIGPDRGSYRKSAEALVSGQKYTLVDVKKLPPSLAAGEVSSQPVHQDADTALALVARRYAEAVGVVTLVGKNSEVPAATAWAFAPKLFASNAHVTTEVEQYLAKGVRVHIYLNRKQGEGLRVVKAITHPKYSAGKLAYDVGVLEVASPVSTYFPIAKEQTLQGVEAGTRVAFLGFPMEGLAGDNLNLASPVATMQSGIITAVSDYDLGDRGFARNRLLRHNLPATGGASGSPIFNANGAVVALLSGGNVIGQVVMQADRQTGKEVAGIKRAPSAAMINFGHRADLLWDIISQPGQ